MEYFKFKKIISESRKVKLSDKERLVMRSNFLASIGAAEIKIESKLNTNPKVAFALVVACLLAVVVPVTYASERALPGDVLYPVKTKITEPVKRVVEKVVSEDSADEDYQLKLLERRLEEANKLLEKKEPLDEKRNNKVKSSIDIQAKKSIEAIDRAESKLLEKKEADVEIKIEKVELKTEEKVERIREKLEKIEEKENVGNKANKSNKGRERVNEVLKKHQKVVDDLDLNL